MVRYLPTLSDSNSNACCNMCKYATRCMIALLCIGAVAGAFLWGRSTASKPENSFGNIPLNRIHPDMLSATATHGSSNLAVCTAPVDDDAEGFFTLDYLTGDLKGWVYYPRMAAFGGLFATNVQAQLGQSKNPEYLLVSGAAAPAPTGGNTRPAASLIYVVDTRSGQFAAYTIPWNRSVESSGAPQMGQFVLVGGDAIRGPVAAGGGAAKKPPAPINPPKNNNPANNQNNLNADPNNADPNVPNPNPNNNGNKKNPR